MRPRWHQSYVFVKDNPTFYGPRRSLYAPFVEASLIRTVFILFCFALCLTRRFADIGIQDSITWTSAGRGCDCRLLVFLMLFPVFAMFLKSLHRLRFLPELSSRRLTIMSPCSFAIVYSLHQHTISPRATQPRDRPCNASRALRRSQQPTHFRSLQGGR